MKKKYLLPKIEIIIIKDDEIIQTSGSSSSYDLGEWVNPNFQRGGN